MLNLKKLHYLSGVVITVFVGLHLLNHSYGVLGIEKHISLMEVLRHFYRNMLVESILMLAIISQIYSGLKLFFAKRKSQLDVFEKLHIWSGIYLSIFFVIHVGAILVGRNILHLDTNFYFGAAGINTFPVNLFFIPYYMLAIMSFFGHIAAIHDSKMKSDVLGLSPRSQSKLIFLVGVIITMLIMSAFTQGFRGMKIPDEYSVLVAPF